ncbi:MAG: PHP domain-containing protein [Actinobacteria bacterium]|nr:PHP domain-containing protein [Actinomycetota bacterium]MBW3643254.1 PHP domain-containing protein [Actinomycetota bacterium]
MDPASALARIGYLLDRAHEPVHRARAYHRAAAVVAALPGEELSERARTGRLTDLEHIGPKTAAVITEALSGGVPAYLTRLEETTTVAPGSPDGAELLAALRGDCHTHSTWSDGGAPVATMARAARDLGHEYLVLTDHSPRLRVANGLSPERLRRQLDEVAAVNAELAAEAGAGAAPAFRVLTGIEVDILDDGALDQDDELLGALDLVVASVHSKLRMDERSMTRRMATAVANPHVDVLGHCTGRLRGGKRPESSFDAELVFHACAHFDTAVEVNCRPERLDPPRRLLALAVEAGCRFAVDTDAHAPGQLEWQPYGVDRLAEAGVGTERVVNAASADEVRAWTASHG